MEILTQNKGGNMFYLMDNLELQIVNVKYTKFVVGLKQVKPLVWSFLVFTV